MSKLTVVRRYRSILHSVLFAGTGLVSKSKIGEKVLNSRQQVLCYLLKVTVLTTIGLQNKLRRGLYKYYR